jgi:hypothetical protein
MCRIGEEMQQKSLLMPHVKPMNFTGRAMKGYVFIEPQGIDLDNDLDYWIKACIAFNPLAKSSRNKNG